MSGSEIHWSHGLLQDLSCPSTWILSNNRVVVVADKYPKAELHFLVLPRHENIPDIYHLRRHHLRLLHEMFLMALDTISLNGRKSYEFQIGYHVQPSMQLLHLHVISTDFHSPHLKRPRHWNNFHTNMFLTHQELVKRIELYGRIEQFSDRVVSALLETPLKCHQCHFRPRTMYALKKHISVHLNNNSQQRLPF